MKRLLVLGLAAALAMPVVTAPQAASAQSYEGCRQYERKKANNGTVIGGLGGALVGSAVAGRGDRTEGAVIGGVVGAVAGHQIAKKNVKCAPYRSATTSQRRAASTRTGSSSNCRWVEERYGGRDHSYQVCRGRDGVWRPS